MSASSAAVHSAAAARWRTLSLAEQLGHIGSEVDRAIRARDGGQFARLENSLARALELFDLTAADDRWRGARRREVLRAREEFCQLLFDESSPARAARTLRAYFLAFAVLARRGR